MSKRPLILIGSNRKGLRRKQISKCVFFHLLSKLHQGKGAQEVDVRMAELGSLSIPPLLLDGVVLMLGSDAKDVGMSSN